jgi:hypothetical protein
MEAIVRRPYRQLSFRFVEESDNEVQVSHLALTARF